MNGESNETDSNSDCMRADNSMRGRGRSGSGSRIGFGIECPFDGCVNPADCANTNACLYASASAYVAARRRLTDASAEESFERIATEAEKAGAGDHHQQHEYQLKRREFRVFIRRVIWGIFGDWLDIIALFLVCTGCFVAGIVVGSIGHDHARSKPGVVPQHDVVHPVQERLRAGVGQVR